MNKVLQIQLLQEERTPNWDSSDSFMRPVIVLNDFFLYSLSSQTYIRPSLFHSMFNRYLLDFIWYIKTKTYSYIEFFLKKLSFLSWLSDQNFYQLLLFQLECDILLNHICRVWMKLKIICYFELLNSSFLDIKISHFTSIIPKYYKIYEKELNSIKVKIDVDICRTKFRILNLNKRIQYTKI